MAAVDLTNIHRAIIKHMADSSDASMETAQPVPLDPTDKPYWYMLSVPITTEQASREFPRKGQLTVVVVCRVALSSNLWTVSSFASEIAEHLNRRYIQVYDYESSPDGTLVGHIQLREPMFSREKQGQTWQEITITVKGNWQLDTGSTLQALPRL